MLEAMKAVTITIDDLFNHKPFTRKPSFFAQPKIYGVRGRWDARQQKLFTRQGNEICSIPHIIAEIKRHPLREHDFEGELYSDLISFDELQGIIRNGLNKGSNHFLRRIYNARVDSIQLYIFDLIEPNITCAKRVAKLSDYSEDGQNVCTLPHYLIVTEEEARDLYNQCIDEGFEGIVFRNAKLCYGDKGALYRVKPINKMECVLLGWKDKNTLILQVKNGPEFYCSGMSERTQRIIYARYPKKSMVPILYDRINPNGRPTFARVDNDLIV